MAVTVRDVPQWEWKPLAMRGCHGVTARVLLVTKEVVTVLARFEPHASTSEHSSTHPTDVICLRGSGSTSVRVEVEPEGAALTAGKTLRWPADKLHRLWTDEERMTVLMLEHVGTPDEGPEPS